MSVTRLVIASRNPHKIHEMARILPPGYEVVSLAEYPSAPEVEESGRTFADNARLKALGISAVVPGLVLSDDSGLCVDTLSGYPGVLSARYAGEHGDDMANNRKLLAELRALPGQAPFRARFVCALCLAEGGRVLAGFEGKVEGKITLEPRGERGFGYDPLFVPDGFSCTFAELTEEEKNRVSHRADALRQLADFLANRAG